MTSGAISLEGTISFAQRNTARLPPSPTNTHVHDEETCDFLALVTAVADLYSNPDVLEMQGRAHRGRPLGRGAVSQVLTVNAAMVRPSANISTQINRERRVVVIKRADSRIFFSNGRPCNISLARSFISEIRILSHPPLRQHPNIIRILGINWDYFHTNYPEPLILVEKADMDLREFQKANSSLPFATKKSIALDIGAGLSALHQCGIIHGDLKPQNVLIFSNPTYHAKVSDFSHSCIDNGEVGTLVGGTYTYAAPEWQTCAATASLRKTDIYSFGLIFSGLILGCEPATALETGERIPAAAFHCFKEDDTMRDRIYKCLLETDRSRPDLHLEEFPMIKTILDCTLQLDPAKRDLDRVLQLLSRGTYKHQFGLYKLDYPAASPRLSIPYHDLRFVSMVVMDHIVDSLKLVAESKTDTRRAAACTELAICYACDLVKETCLNKVPDSEQSVTYLIRAAELGDKWARCIVARVAQGMQVAIPDKYPVQDWLYDAARKGSRDALASLRDLDRAMYDDALMSYRTTFWRKLLPGFTTLGSFSSNPGDIVSSEGDTFLHWIASSGQLDILQRFRPVDLPQNVLDSRNDQGDTPLLCAVRAGHYGMLVALVNLNADGRITNNAGENGLHFLGSLNAENVNTAANLLVMAGAQMDAEAEEYTGITYFETRPIVKGCPKLRAAMLNYPHALRALFDVEQTRWGLESQSHRSLTAFALRFIVAWAIRLCYTEILEVLRDYLSSSKLIQELQGARFWTNGARYSLIELWVLGSASSCPLSGIDMPNRFWRYINHSSKQHNALERSLLFLRDLDQKILEIPCFGARNPTFFAIKEGNRDAFRCLHTHFPKYETTFPVTKCRKEIHSRIMHVNHKRVVLSEERRKRLDFPRRSNKFVPPIKQAAYGPDKSDPARARVFEERKRDPERSHLEREQWIYGRSGEFRSLHDVDSDDEADLQDNANCIDVPPKCGPFDFMFAPLEQSSTEPSPEDAAFAIALHEGEAIHPLPNNYRKWLGLVDAVLLSILCGQRGIFHDLITGPASVTMSLGSVSLCYVRAGCLDTVMDYEDLRPFFPENVSCQTIRRSKPRWSNGYVEFDGRLNYTLLYMATIARSRHRDIFLAEILTNDMTRLGLTQPAGWTTNSWFEDMCLSLDDSCGQTCALYQAASLRWDDLSLFLLKHGASPQGTCYMRQERNVGEPYKATVLSRLVGSTHNINGEVETLLRQAVTLRLDHIINMRDVTAIFATGPNAGHHLDWDWKDGKLFWRHHEHWLHSQDIRLWQSISQAAKAQGCLIKPSRSDGAYILEAAWRRDVPALQTLLDLGLDPNYRAPAWKVWKLNITAIDVVAWTNAVTESFCTDSGLVLKERDAKIVAMLRAYKGTRGREFLLEYQIVLGILQSFVTPVVVLIFLVSAHYTFDPWMSNICSWGWDTLKEDWKGHDDKVIVLVIYCMDRVITGGWALLLTVHCLVWCYDDDDDGRSSNGGEQVFIFSFLGIFATTAKVLVAHVTDDELASAVIYNSFLVDAAIYIFILLLFFSVAFPCLIPGYWWLGRLWRLAEELQGGCALVHVRNALYRGASRRNSPRHRATARELTAHRGPFLTEEGGIFTLKTWHKPLALVTGIGYCTSRKWMNLWERFMGRRSEQGERIGLLEDFDGEDVSMSPP
ncbi:hypothetical protein BDV24DRAFT_158927 [Aspergillus arachidicola]|uniref:Protein kinase domain-containing protein n=1 Tax=Aspergillus arachidicola TaxID=656916 RepID=A0A5N6YRE1_9EURO|nr:hypothetical protein BDV24DRAFT_158927 [Aspergillus arachidicola]